MSRTISRTHQVFSAALDHASDALLTLFARQINAQTAPVPGALWHPPLGSDLVLQSILQSPALQHCRLPSASCKLHCQWRKPVDAFSNCNLASRPGSPSQGCTFQLNRCRAWQVHPCTLHPGCTSEPPPASRQVLAATSAPCKPQQNANKSQWPTKQGSSQLRCHPV